MSLLAPLFLLGSLAIGLPFWLHRLQIQSTEREKFSSTKFLQPSEKRIHTRRKLRYLVLLVTRIILLLLLALAFAKPIIERQGLQLVDAGGVLHLVVIDTSLSMQHENRFGIAIDEARDLVAALPSSDASWLITASNTVDIVVGPSSENSDTASVLGSLSPGDGRLDLGAVVENLNVIVGSISPDVSRVTIHLFSDFQASGVPARFSDLLPDPVYEKTIGLELHPVGKDIEPNWAVEFVNADATGVDVSVRGINTGAADRNIGLRVNGISRGERLVSLAESGADTVRFDGVEYEQGGNRLIVEFSEKDELPGDDRYYAQFENIPPVPVLIITADTRSRAVLYLSTAIESDQAGYAAEVVDVSSLDERILSRYPWIIIDDLGILRDQLEAAVRTYLESGGAMLAAMGSASASRNEIPVTGTGLGAGSISSKPVYGVSQIDNSHPVLAGTSGWQAVNVRQVLPVEPGESELVLIALDDSRPLLLEGHIGQGRYLLFASSLENDWNDLPIHPVFVNFMVEAARYLSSDQLVERQMVLGDSINLRQTGFSSGQVVDTHGQRVLELADTLQAQTVMLTSTGFYEVYTSGAESLVAVNTDGRESDLTAMTPAQLAAWRDAAESTTRQLGEVDGNEPVLEIMATPPLEIWRWVLLMLLVSVIVESVLGNHHLARETGTVQGSL